MMDDELDRMTARTPWTYSTNAPHVASPGAVARFRVTYVRAFPPANPAMAAMNLTGRWLEFACAQPDEVLDAITPEMLREAKSWGDRQQLGWGPGTFTMWLAETGGTVKSERVTTREVTDDDRRRVFFALPEAERKRWIAAARARHPSVPRVVVVTEAIKDWWKEQQR